ncbi:MAG: dihydrolipoamide acetyltransferase family protein [Acidimicrobiales bacterium]
MADIELPQLGESVTEGTITQWFKAVGDQVAEDEPLYEVSTDKVDSEVPSPASGYLAEILVEEGDTVDVGTKVAVLSDAPPGEGGGGASEPAEPSEDAGEDAQSAVEPEPDDSPADDEGPEQGGGDEAAPAAEAPEQDDAEAEAEASGEDESKADAPAAAQAAAEGEAIEAAQPEAPPGSAASSEPPAEPAAGKAPSGGDGGGGAAVLSPVVRRLLDEAGVDASAVTGTGIGGRVTRVDAESHIRQQQPAGEAAGSKSPEPDSAPSPAPRANPPAPPVEQRVASGTDETVPLNKIRRITAEHMVRSLGTSAHAYVSTEVDYEAVERVRAGHRARFKAEEGASLTYLPFVARALVDAIAEFPQVNASMGEGTELVVHGSVHLGVAVDLDHEGLIVPVVHDAQDQRLRSVARTVADLAGRAKTKRLTASDITGGTVTITNIGSTGNTFLLPIINQPQVIILSTDGVHRRPVVVVDDFGNESIAIHSVGSLTLGWDHRAFDGAYAAQFLARLRDILQTRDWEAEL